MEALASNSISKDGIPGNLRLTLCQAQIVARMSLEGTLQAEIAARYVCTRIWLEVLNRSLGV
jgi:hypothetical protein